MPEPAETPDSLALQARLDALESELEDLRMLQDTIIDHGTTLENELIDLVSTLTKVSTDLEKGEFYPQDLAGLVDRPDEMGQLGRAFRTMGLEVSARDRRLRMLRVVIPAGVALSAEKDFSRLLETIAVESQKLCSADAAGLYLLTDERLLKPVIYRNESLGIHMGGTSGKPVTLEALPLYDEQGQPDQSSLPAHVALNGVRVNVADLASAQNFDFSQVRAFDAQHGYQTRSILAIPLQDVQENVVGIIQMTNARDPQTGEPAPFVIDDVIESLIMLASAALSSYSREEQLRQEIEQLRIQIDIARRDRQVAEVVESDYFQQLQRRAQELRKRKLGLN